MTGLGEKDVWYEGEVSNLRKVRLFSRLIALILYFSSFGGWLVLHRDFRREGLRHWSMHVLGAPHWFGYVLSTFVFTHSFTHHSLAPSHCTTIPAALVSPSRYRHGQRQYPRVELAK
jgi:hypothetical protein